MKDEQVKGKAKEIAGETQEHVGRMTGDREQEARGHAREQEGKVEKKVGDLKDGLDKIIRKP
ncbi:MAG TPA: CsbD family protein [Ramlibacter sp.]|nr:CsbD family protein [Ramlibacter sp.]